MDQPDQSQTDNQRKSTRFIRKDIKSSIIRTNLLGFKETINCKLLDISSTGVQVSSKIILGTNVKLTLILQFADSHKFKLKAKVVRHNETDHYLSTHSFPTIKKFLENKDTPLKTLHLFETNYQIFAKYRNLSNTNVKILTHTPLNKKKHHSLVFTLNNEEEHKTDTQIEHYQHHIYYNYGLKFEKVNDELGEHLLETQTELVFK